MFVSKKLSTATLLLTSPQVNYLTYRSYLRMPLLMALYFLLVACHQSAENKPTIDQTTSQSDSNGNIMVDSSIQTHTLTETYLQDLTQTVTDIVSETDVVTAPYRDSPCSSQWGLF